MSIVYSLVVHGISVNIHSQDTEFVRVVEQLLKPFIVSEVSSPNLEIHFEGYHVLQRSTPKGRDAYPYHLGYTIHYTDDELIFHNARLVVTVKWRDGSPNRLCVKCSFYERPDHTLRRWFLRQSQYKQQNYENIVRYVVYYPIFWYLERFQSKLPLHGSAIERDGKVVIFTGINGSGKSTLAAYACLRGSFASFADNWVLFDRNKVYSFPDVVRLNRWSSEALRLDREPEGFAHGKYHYQHDDISAARSGVPVLLFDLRFGTEISISELPLSVMLQRIEAQMRFLGESHQYTYLTFLKYPLRERGLADTGVGDTGNMLAACMKNARCYQLTLGKNDSLNEVYAEIERLFGSCV